MSQHTVNLEEYGLDLLSSMVALEPHKRISCRMAMQHPYFDDLDKTKLAKDYWLSVQGVFVVWESGSHNYY